MIEDEFVVALRRIIRALDLHSRKLVQSVGLTWPQLAALRAIARSGSCSIGFLARDIRLSQATLTGIVQRLERAGLILRSRHERDRRSVIVAITDAGADLLDRAPSLLQDRFRSALAKLKDWERFQALASLQRIAEMMDVESLDASSFLMDGSEGDTSTEAQAKALAWHVAPNMEPAPAAATPQGRDDARETEVPI